MLLELCPSKKMRREAKRISKKPDSCEKCVFSNCNSPNCWYPYSDAYIDSLEIDHCYEGVLRFLVKEGKKGQESIVPMTVIKNNELTGYMNTSVEELYNCLDIINILSGLILEMSDKNNKISPDLLSIIRRMHETGEIDERLLND